MRNQRRTYDMYRRIFERILWCGLLSAALWCAGSVRPRRIRRLNRIRVRLRMRLRRPTPGRLPTGCGTVPTRPMSMATTPGRSRSTSRSSTGDCPRRASTTTWATPTSKEDRTGRGDPVLSQGAAPASGQRGRAPQPEVAEARTKDDIESIPEFFLTSRLREVRRTMGCTAWSVLSLGFLAAAAALPAALPAGAAARAAQGGILRHAGGGGSLRGRHVVRRARTARHAAPRRGGGHGRILGRESSPDRAATDLFVLHEGTVVRVTAELGDWAGS